MVDAFLKIDVQEVNGAINAMEKRITLMLEEYTATTNKTLARMEEIQKNTVELLAAGQGQVKTTAEALGILRTMDPLKLTMTGQDLEKYLEQIFTAKTETLQITEALQEFAPKFSEIANNTIRLVNQVMSLEALLKSKAVGYLLKEMKEDEPDPYRDNLSILSEPERLDRNEDE